MQQMKNIAVMPSTKGKSGRETSQIINWFEEHQMNVMLPEGWGRSIDREELDRSIPQIRESADLMISLGGDGTLLKACNIIAGTPIPVLGINLGHLGFLTETSLDNWESTIKRTLAGDYEIENRMMAICEVLRDEVPVFGGVALNDVVVSHGGEMVLLKFSLKISDNYAGTYSADGVIVATPTGSTAYSLAAGGPIVNPKLECLLLTAICPHTLTARPLVVPASEIIEIRERSGRGCDVTIDGHSTFRATSKDVVRVKKCDCSVRFIHLGKKFYTTIREKLKWFE